MIRLGVTGGIGSGKSTVCRVFQLFGVPVYYADAQAKWLIENNNGLVSDIRNLIGEEAYLKGKYNSSFVSKKVFNDKELLTQLNKLVHPVVRQDWCEWSQSRQHYKLLVKEAAIMQAAKDDDQLDKVLYVFGSVANRIERVAKRDTFRSRETIENIITKQRSDESYRSIADFVINNDGTELVIPQVMEVIEKLIATS